MRQTQRAVLPETKMETNNLPAVDESRFPLSSDELLKETLKKAENNWFVGSEAPLHIVL